MNCKKLLILGVLLLGALNVSAQMTDDQVIEYVKNGTSAGKGESQIGRELLARGVTHAQMERIKARYEESQGSEARVVDQSVGAQNRERYHDASNDVAAGTFDEVTATVGDPTELSPEDGASLIYGHSIFNNRTLSFEPNENLATPEDYRLGPGDEVIVDIWGTSEDNVRQVISPEGNIMVSQIGPVYLNGLTIKEANAKLRRVFANKYADVLGDDPASDVRVTLGQIRTIQINVMGEVMTPGTYRLSSFSTVFHALYRAGGITGIGSMRHILVMRAGKQVGEIDVYEYLFNGKHSQDIRLQEGDVIMVPPYDLLVSVEGNVKRPMHYELKKGETMETLLGYAGGFTGDAYTAEVRLVRQTGREHELFNVGEAEFASCRLEDGDAVTVGATLDRFANRVEIRGSVYRPGMYEVSPKLATVKQLVERADGLMDDAFKARVQLFRETEDLSLEVVALDLDAILAGRAPDVALRRNDLLVIPSVHELEVRGALTIAGQVARPGVYPYAENMTVEDLISQAGGLLEGASTARIDVSRRLKDPRSTTASSVLGKVYSVSFKDGYVVDGEPGFRLEPFDLVEVRRSPGYMPQRRVSVDGEVTFPGGYTLLQKNERLSDLVARAGGLTPDAYAHGARLVRRMNEEERAVRAAAVRMASQTTSEDSVSMQRLEFANTYTVGIELDKALASPGSDYDMVLREGDMLVVPELISTVKINGDVMYPNTVLYVAGKGLKHYIEQAGGYGNRARKGKVFVVYMNGTVVRARRMSRIRFEPGCEIIVPSKPERENGRMSISEIMGLTTSAASLGTMAATVANILK